jgi:hypothetical protein
LPALRQIDRKRQPDGTCAHHDDRIFGHLQADPILVGMAAIAELDSGLRHALKTLPLAKDAEAC